MPSAWKISKGNSKSISKYSAAEGRRVHWEWGEFLNSPEFQNLWTFQAGILWKTKQPLGMSLPWPLWLLLWVRRAQGAASHSIQLPRELLGRGNSWFEDYCKNLWCLEREALLQKRFVHKGSKVAFHNPRIVLEWLRAQIKALLMGSESWAETWEDLDGGKVLQWFQQISDLEGSGSSSSQLGRTEVNPLPSNFPRSSTPIWELEKVDLFYYIFFVWGSENTENSLLEAVPVQPWTSPDSH